MRSIAPCFTIVICYRNISLQSLQHTHTYIHTHTANQHYVKESFPTRVGVVRIVSVLSPTWSGTRFGKRFDAVERVGDARWACRARGDLAGAGVCAGVARTSWRRQRRRRSVGRTLPVSTPGVRACRSAFRSRRWPHRPAVKSAGVDRAGVMPARAVAVRRLRATSDARRATRAVRRTRTR